MKTIIITFKTPLRVVAEVNEHVTCLGDAILKTKGLHPDMKIRDVVNVITIDDADPEYQCSPHEIERQKRACKLDHACETVLNELAGKYHFTEDEKERLFTVLRELATDIESIAGVTFNQALSQIVSK